MSVAETMRKKLEAAFAPTALDVVDESEQHRGHGGWREGGETHFRVRLVTPAFEGESRVARSRAVHKALEAELAEKVHALALELRTPAEAAAAAKT
ncbi:MAG: BolA family transcriptional regulator [Rhodobacteraceae bacterium]|nr:MAG: BolA family transcriptional regulator [Paracoccaceae bacterium]